jgi:hypothetical protein
VLVGFGCFSLYLSHATQLNGDEHFYFINASVLSKFLLAAIRMQPLDIAETLDRIVGLGWFAPGLSLILTPIQLLFGGEAPLPAVRAYMTIFNLVLLGLISRELIRLGFTRRFTSLFVVAVCAVPYYLFFLGMLWGDLVGVHLALLVLLDLERRLLESQPRGALTNNDSRWVGLLLGATILVRPQYSFLLLIIVVRIFLQSLRSSEAENPHRGSWAAVLKTSAWITLSIVIVLAPWNYELNKRFGRSFMITSTYLSPLFRDPGYSEGALREIATINKFYAVHDKVTADARAAGRSFREQADLESAKIAEMDLDARLRATQNSMSRYYFSENQFLNRFFGLQTPEGKFSGPLGEGLLFANAVFWYLLLSLGFLAFSIPAFPQKDGYLLPLSIKGLVFLLTMQPLLLDAHGRYYVALVPALALLVLFALRANPRGIWTQHRRCSLHDGLIAAGQALALFYGTANVWLFLAN